MLFGRFEHVKYAAPELASVIHDQPRASRLIRVEGCDKVGKSTLSQNLTCELRATLLQTDKFRLPAENWMTYIETVRVDEFQHAVKEALDAGGWVIADSVCLDEVLPESTFGRGFRIYVMSLRPYNGEFLQWPYGAALQREPVLPTKIDLSIRNYHLTFAPHRRADAIVQVTGPYDS